MKKILSVALSTAMAFSMFASVAFGQAGLTDVNEQYSYLKDKGIFSGFPDGQAHLDRQMTRAEFAKVITKTLGLKEITGVYSFKDKNYGPKHWAAPFVEAVSAAGIMEGKNTTKKIFDLSGPVTVQEMATVLVRALDLEIPTETNNTATQWAKGYVQAAINAGLVDAKANFQSNATRALLVGAAYEVDQEISLQVKSYTVSEGGKVVEFKMSDDETVKVTLDKALEANKETEVKFTYKEKEFTEKVTYAVTTATKLDKVSADNLREVKVAFDGEVDAATAEDESNYSITGDGTPVVKSVKLSADKKVATLTVAKQGLDNEGLSNQKEYKLSVTNVRAGSKVISASDVKFTPVDAALPTATSAQALGNKTVKITFSEPVQVANPNSFMIDGKTVVGTTEVTGNVVILKLYSTLSNAEHTVTASGVQDYSGLKNQSTELKFTVVEDTAAPTISAVEKATFEEVTLKFSEPVDKATVLASNVYWMQGSTKRTASSVTAIEDDTYKFTFNSTNRLVYNTDLFVTDVKDYSGNVIAKDTKVAVTPVVDQTRPEVVNAQLQDDRQTIRVKFSKNVTTDSATKAANYVVKDADGKVVSSLKQVTVVDAKTVDVKLYQKLAEGKKFTLEISGVADTTTLNNVMLPYAKDLETSDKTAPTVTGVTYITDSNRVVVNFNEVMATSGDGSIVEASKYSYKGATGGYKSLPAGSYLNVSTDGKAAIIVFPSDVKVGTDVTGIRVSLVKDLAGNYLENLQSENNLVEASSIALATGENVVATATNKLEVKFNQDLQANSATPSDFTVKAGGTELAVTSATVDGSKVILTLSDNNKLDSTAKFNDNAPTVTVKAKGSLVTPAGKQVATQQISASVKDEIAPAIKSISDTATVSGSTYVDVTFTEAVTLGSQGQYDFELKQGSTTLKLTTDYTVAQQDNGVRITFTSEYVAANKGKVVDVRVKPYPSFITDAKGNVVSGSESFFSTYLPE